MLGTHEHGSEYTWTVLHLHGASWEGSPESDRRKSWQRNVSCTISARDWTLAFLAACACTLCSIVKGVCVTHGILANSSLKNSRYLYKDRSLKICTEATTHCLSCENNSYRNFCCSQGFCRLTIQGSVYNTVLIVGRCIEKKVWFWQI